MEVCMKFRKIIKIRESFDFVCEKHKIGYTTGVYSKCFPTYILDINAESNIIFQEYGYFWFKKGFAWSDINSLAVESLVFIKSDSMDVFIKQISVNVNHLLLDDIILLADNAMLLMINENI